MKDVRDITPYNEPGIDKKQQVTRMFDTISKEYDSLNRVISFGIDKKWRKKVVELVLEWNPEDLLDVATGTGDLALLFAKKSDKLDITGLDLSQGMLSIAEQKADEQYLEHRVAFVRGDSEKLVFPDKSFDAVTVAFGIRNFENLDKGLNEILRVLRPGGILCILETSVPQKSPYNTLYHFYSKNILPKLGRWFSKDRSAYSYLSESAAAFPYGQEMCNILTKIGFTDVEAFPQTFGVATIYTSFRE